MATRQLYLLQWQTSLIELAFPRRELGWTVRISKDLDRVPTPAEVEGCDVGLVVIDPIDSFNSSTLEKLVTAHSFEWIAVLEARVLQEPELARSILKYFHDFHTLPLDADRLHAVLGHAHGRAQLRHRFNGVEHDLAAKHQMVGKCPAMRSMLRNLDKIARVDAPVLISGESGTGKELAARAIHRNSSRNQGPFVAVDCGALPPSLIQSELFGHEKGSFTGAHQRKIGRIESAAGGVIFLDEIGNLALDLQSNLLRFLQERTIVRVGSTQPIPIDVRVVSASHIDLPRAVVRGEFREDLYYRLNVLHIELPPLRARRSDIPLLAEAVFNKYRAQRGPLVRGFSIEALLAMEEYAWPGNVRELINRVQNAMIMCDGRLITPRDLGLSADRAQIELPTLHSARNSIEKDVVLQTLVHNHYNVSAAARQLGVSRVTLYRLKEKFKIAHRGNGGIESEHQGALFSEPVVRQ